MGDLNRSRQTNDLMSWSIYDFLETLVDAIRPPETVRNTEPSTTVSNIVPGGYNEDIFIFLSDRERDEYSCGICYCVLKDAHQCGNGHRFCYSCIYVWSTSDRVAADDCPVCRGEGTYARIEQINERLNRKRVKCQQVVCNWRGFLAEFTEHEHRIYDFRELKNVIELPSIAQSKYEAKSSVIESQSTTQNHPISTPSPPPTSMSRAGVNSSNLNYFQNGGTSSRSTTSTETDSNLTNNNNNRTTPVSREPLQPRMLGHRHRLGSSTQPMQNRPLGPTPRISSNVSNPSGSYRISATLTNYANTRSTPRLPRPSLPTSLTSTNTENNTVSSSPRGSLTDSEQMGHVHSSINTSVLPSINSKSHLESLEYRRLAPTYAERRRSVYSESREQLAMMLILLTSDFDDRPIGISASNNSNDSPTRNTSLTTSRPPSEDSISTQTPTTTRLGRNRLQEFRNLNRRLSEVANSLDRLIESTSRDNSHTNSNGPNRRSEYPEPDDSSEDSNEDDN